ncbi:MAG: hypothetical protein HPY66_2469 [Firmicutes bacterium]|nr:hypothetical protein [Bacillota bacterium]
MNSLTVSAIIFVVAMLGVGVFVSRRIESAEEFFVGGRKVHPILIVCTLVASEVGGGAMLAAVGLGYSSGWGVMWYVAPFGVGALAFAFLLAKKIKEAGDKYGYQSMFDWLAGRYEGYVPIRIVGGLVMLAGLFGALASQYVAMGTALNSITGLSLAYGALIGGIVIIIYSTLGGLYSVMWTDLLQAVIFIFGMVVVLPMLLIKAGGFSGIQAGTPAAYWTLFPKSVEWHFVMLATMTVAPFVRQYYYQRMFAARSFTTARNSMLIQSAVLFITPVWAALVGMSIYAINPGLSNPEVAMPWALKEILPTVVGVIVLGAIIAAIMSTGDTLLNAAALTFVRDIFRPLRPEAKEEDMLKYAKISTAVIGIISLIVAVFSKSVIGAIMKAWAILGGGLFVPMVVSYYWKKSTREGVLISLIVGLVVTLYLTIVQTPVPAIFGGLGASFIALVVGSIATFKKGEKQTSETDVN